MNTQDTPQQDAPISNGQRLRLAREQLGLSQSTVAAKLCLKVSTVRDIEEDNIPDNLVSTFTRGYIRSYAKLVHIPEEELLPPQISKQSAIRQSKVSTMQSFSDHKRRKKRDGWLMICTWVILIIIIGLTGAWWWQNHRAQQETVPVSPQNNALSANSASPAQSASAGNPANPQRQNTPPDNITTTNNRQQATERPSVPLPLTISQQPSAPPSAASPVLSPTPPANSTTQQSAGQTPTSPPPVDQPVTNPNRAALPVTPSTSSDLSAASHTGLTLRFTASCWIEVRDHSGKILFSGLKHNQDQLVLNGQPPYRLVIGVPGAVHIHYQGKDVDLSRFPANRVARLTLNAAP